MYFIFKPLTQIILQNHKTDTFYGSCYGQVTGTSINYGLRSQVMILVFTVN